MAYYLIGNVTHKDINEEWELGTQKGDSDSLYATTIFTAMNKLATAFPGLMEHLANSVSLSLRTVPYQPKITGTAMSETNRAVVRWEWLAPPLFELVASLIFLITVIMETRRRGLQP
jgi:hypothetical protein